ncbi:MAG: sigma-54-dependent Fis family transcriptional regulator [Candidatus Tectomicrobia bacterium]|uniref:Sigma-54-dependent Fis family transcriptional regulator n=1 Tax=Tectimicrobiota bacterium TaxID=2528274 RepID=A0A932CMG5_UNCTE|nr:sigma-54-dependent Fis family transcriptional regulator [Candidatus Tectomicrobia bacterium]
MKVILVVDDELHTCEALKMGLEKEGYGVLTVETGQKAMEIAQGEKIDLILTDLKMPGMDGLKFLKAVKSIQPKVAVVVITGHGSIDSAVAAMREGAYDYITKPFKMAEIKKVVSKALETRDLLVENENLKAQIQHWYAFKNIIGSSKRLVEILKLVEQIAPSRSTVLLTGESGTGKELIAQAIHCNSFRTGQPFIKVNCAALPDTLLEAELFGYEKGAFTGALKSKPGRFELADSGTLFLDEIGEANPALQLKLLRVLQEGEFERLGGTQTLKVDVRIIAATNCNLREAVAEKRFRNDLYYRLNVMEIELPPLRERPEDIPLLTQHFIEKYSQINNKEVRSTAPEVMKIFQQYDWPGNIRELENVIEHAVVLCLSEIITPQELPDYLPQNNSAFTGLCLELPEGGIPLEEIERKAILKTLEKTAGDKVAAAQILGIGLSTLYRKLKVIQPQ